MFKEIMFDIEEFFESIPFRLVSIWRNSCSKVAIAIAFIGKYFQVALLQELSLDWMNAINAAEKERCRKIQAEIERELDDYAKSEGDPELIGLADAGRYQEMIKRLELGK